MTSQRFTVANLEVSQSLGQYTIVMLGDIGYWVDNYDALEQWCAVNGGSVQGMTVNIPDDQTLTAFCLRWS